MNTAQFLKSRSTKTVWLKEEKDPSGKLVVNEYPEEVQGGVPFKIRRIMLDDVGRWALDVAFRMPIVQSALEHAKAASDDLSRELAGEIPSERPDPNADDVDYQSIPSIKHMVVQEAYLIEGMVEPAYDEVRDDLGPYKSALAFAIYTFSERVIDDPKL